MATKKWKCHNLDPDTGKRRPDRPSCSAACRGVHPEEREWATALVYRPRRDTARDMPNDRARRNDRQYEHEWDNASPRTFKGHDPPTAPASAWALRKETTSTSSAATSRSSWTNQPHAINRIQTTSTANKAVGRGQDDGSWGSSVGGKDGGWGSPQADAAGWGSPVRDNTGGWGSPVANNSGRDAGPPVNHTTTPPAPRPPVATPKLPRRAVPIEQPFNKPTAKPALSLPPKPSPSVSKSHPNTSNLMEVSPMAAPASTTVVKPAFTPARTSRERSASLDISLPPGFISPSPTPSVPPKPRPPSLRLTNRQLHSRRDSILTSTPVTETGPLSAISVNSNYSGFAVPLVSASPRTAGFAPDSPFSTVSAPVLGGGFRVLTSPEVTTAQGGADKAPTDPAEVLWDENIEIVRRALTRRRELQDAMEQVERRDQFYSTMRARHSSRSIPPISNSPDDPMNQQLQEAQKRYEDMLTELSECKTSWWPTPTFVDPSELTIDLERLEREIEKVMGIPAWSRAEDLAAATTRDNDMNSGKAEQKLDTSSRTTPARLTFADVIRAFDDLENRVEEVEGEIDAHLESSLRRKVRAYLRKKFPPAPRSAMTDVGRLEAALLWAKQAGTRVQGLENRLVGLTVTSNADEIQLVRERITKRRKATRELIKKEESILDFLSIHNASLDVSDDQVKEILKTLTADNELISSIAKPYCDRIQTTIDSIGAATIPEDSQATLRKSRRDRASDEIYELVAGAPQMQQQLTMADWVQKNWGRIKSGEPLSPRGIGQQSVAMDIVMG